MRRLGRLINRTSIQRTPGLQVSGVSRAAWEWDLRVLPCCGSAGGGRPPVQSCHFAQVPGFMANESHGQAPHPQQPGCRAVHCSGPIRASAIITRTLPASCSRHSPPGFWSHLWSCGLRPTPVLIGCAAATATTWCFSSCDSGSAYGHEINGDNWD